MVLPTAATRESSELMGSRAMRDLIQDLKRTYQNYTIIVDLPPILSSDDVIAGFAADRLRIVGGGRWTDQSLGSFRNATGIYSRAISFVWS